MKQDTVFILSRTRD